MANRFDIYNAYRNDSINFDQARFLLSRLDGDSSMEEIDSKLDLISTTNLENRQKFRNDLIRGVSIVILALIGIMSIICILELLVF